MAERYRMKHAKRTSPGRVVGYLLLTAVGILLLTAGAYMLAQYLIAPQQVTAPVVEPATMVIREIEPTAANNDQSEML